jgi:uncharacterized membrane protein YdbT with pleckstrin-like domain
MFCIKCGTKNVAEAVYCHKCGNPFDVEEETQLVAKSEKEEVKVFSIRPTLMFIQAGYVTAIAGAFLLVAVLYYFGKTFGLTIPQWLSVFSGLSLLVIPVYYHLKRNSVRYTLTDSKVEIDEGFISRTTRNVPLRTIQDVTVSASIPQRLLGFGNLIIENANETDGKIVLKNINSPKYYADILLKQMRLLDK